jgi:hypothetical protein
VCQLDHDQISTLVEIIREQRGNKLSHAELTDAALLLLENVAGFEVLSQKRAQQYIKILWQSYQIAQRDPERSK